MIKDTSSFESAEYEDLKEVDSDEQPTAPMPVSDEESLYPSVNNQF